MGGKRANAAAAILVIAFLLVGAAIITYSQLSPRQKEIDYPRVYSEAQNLLDRVYIESGERLMQNGFSNSTNLWYCNKPLPPNASEVGEGFSFYTQHHLAGTDLQEFLGSGAGEIDVTMPTAMPDFTSDIDALALNITNFTIIIVSADENRTLDLSQDAKVRTRFTYYYKTLHKWMECNAGNLSQNVGKLVGNKSCQFESCCCGSFPVSQAGTDAIAEEYGINDSQLDPILNASVQSLNNLFAGSDSCFTRPATPGSMVCYINWTESRRITENQVFSDWTARSCGSTQCEIKPKSGHNGTPTEWPSDRYTLMGQTCPDRAALPVETGLTPDIGDPMPSAPPTDEESKFFRLALQRRAAANILVTCVARPQGIGTFVQSEMFSVRLRINVKNHCDLSPDEPGDTSAQACVGGAGAACPCPGTPECEVSCEGGTLSGANPSGAKCSKLCAITAGASCGSGSCPGPSCACGSVGGECADRYSCRDPSELEGRCPAPSTCGGGTPPPGGSGSDPGSGSGSGSGSGGDDDNDDDDNGDGNDPPTDPEPGSSCEGADCPLPG